MIPITNIYHSIKVISIADISLIKDLANSVLGQRPQPPLTIILVYFKGPSLPNELVKRIDISLAIDMGE